MKLVIRNLSAVLMAALVLFSTFSFSVGMHYCGDLLVAFSLSGEDLECGMESLDTGDVACTLLGTDCCNDVEIIRQGTDQLQWSIDAPTTLNLHASIPQPLSAAWLISGNYTDYIPFNEYSPPLLIRDVQVLYETFLI